MKKILTFCFASIALLLFTSFSYSKNDNFKNSTYKFGLFVDKSKKTESNSESIDSLYNSNPTKTQIDSARKQFQKHSTAQEPSSGLKSVYLKSKNASELNSSQRNFQKHSPEIDPKNGLHSIYNKSKIRSRVTNQIKNYEKSAKENERVFGGYYRYQTELTPRGREIRDKIASNRSYSYTPEEYDEAFPEPWHEKKKMLPKEIKINKPNYNFMQRPTGVSEQEWRNHIDRVLRIYKEYKK